MNKNYTDPENISKNSNETNHVLYDFATKFKNAITISLFENFESSLDYIEYESSDKTDA